MSLEPSTKRALEGALLKLGASKKEIEDNPTKAGMRVVFGDLIDPKPDPLPNPSKDENAS